MTNLEDALFAAREGADAVGFIFYKKSPRNVSMKTVRKIISALPPFTDAVGVFVNESAEKVNKIAEYCNLDAVQLHGEESPAYCKKIRRKVIKAFRVKDGNSLSRIKSYPASGFLLDAYSEKMPGGTGETFDWKWAKKAKAYGPVILAGGLNPGNVKEAIQETRPYGVDVSSGVEACPGKKDLRKVRAFIKNAKS